MPVNLYENQAQSEGVPWVKRQDRKAVISYLRGDPGENVNSVKRPSSKKIVKKTSLLRTFFKSSGMTD